MSSTNAHKSHVKFRGMRRDDVSQILALEAASFPSIPPDRHWKPEQILAHVEKFPEGQIVAELDGKLVGSATGFRLPLETALRRHTWREITGNGYLATHDPNGDTYYGTEIMVHPDARRRGIARGLYVRRQTLARSLNLRAIVTGGRIPEYEKHAHHMSAADYVKTVVAHGLTDRTLTPQLKSGFTVAGLLPGYLTDEKSRNFATLLVWWNLDFSERAQLVPTSAGGAAERGAGATGQPARKP